MLGFAGWLVLHDRHAAAEGTLAASLGCAALMLPPRERMDVLPWRLRALPRRFDAAVPIACLLSAPGYGLNWFYGANPYDETVHLLSGLLAGWVFGGLLAADRRQRTRLRLIAAGAVFGLVLATAWEAFEWIVALIGENTDTASDILLTTFGAALGTPVGGRRRWPRRATVASPATTPTGAEGHREAA